MNRSSFFFFALLWINSGDCCTEPETTPKPTPTSKPTPNCYEGDGASYRGRKTTTFGGQICQNWNDYSIHPSRYKPPYKPPWIYPNSDLTSNYCRNPDHDPNGPWCYTKDNEEGYEYCGIPKCSVGESANCDDMVAMNRPCGTRFFTQNIQNNPKLSRIVGGINAVRGAYPYQIALYLHLDLNMRHGGFKCGGTIIDANTVITAAHCFIYSKRAADYSIIAGSPKVQNDHYDCAVQKVDVLRLVMHEMYNKDAHENDIAILKLDKSLIFNKYVQPACLPEKDYDYPVGENVLISGWGKLSEKSLAIPNILNAAFVPLISSEDCSNRYKMLHDNGTLILPNITEAMVCAGFASGGVGTCQGDSGGPVVSGSMDATSGMTLVGVVNWGYGCAKPGVPSVYARVTHFLEWISNNRGWYATQVDLRLAGGNATAGRVEVLFDGKWGTICDDHWGMSDAEVVCRQLDLGKPLAITKKASPFGEGSGPILMDNVACSGDKLNIGLCRHRGFNVSNCNHDEDAGVVCSCECECGQRMRNTTEWGNANASSEWSEDFPAWRAFHPRPLIPWTSKTLPATVWYRFDQKFQLAKISFSSATMWGMAPDTFDVVASDDCHMWYRLRMVYGAGFTGSGQTKSWAIPCEKQGEYYCYGIRTSKVACDHLGNYMSDDCSIIQHPGFRGYKRVSITNLTMYF